MNPLHVDALVLIKPSYTERLITIWEEGEFKQPRLLLSLDEATRLRDNLTAALKLDKQHVVRAKS